MGLIPQEDISRVLEANDLVSIAGEVVPGLKQKGGKFVACCPFHKEKTPSFQIDPNLQLWHCFGCGEGGNLVKFVEKKYDMGFREAIEWLADRANIKISYQGDKTVINKSRKNSIIDAYKTAVDFYHNHLLRSKNANANSARKYLSCRKLNSDICKKWKIGFAPGNAMLSKHLLQAGFKPDLLIEANLCYNKNGQLQDRFYNRVMFPIFDPQGNPIAFGGRIMSDAQPKYLNSSEHPLFSKSKVLYGLDKAKNNMTSTGTAIVVEGYTDVIAMHENGINYAVATLGTALTKQHIRLLNQHAKQKIIYLFDGDEAGQRASERALQFIDEAQQPEIYNKRAELFALTLPDNMDPAEFLEAKGEEELRKLLETSKPLIQYGIERKFSQYDLSVAGNKSRAATAALRILAPIKNSFQAQEYVRMIADKSGLREEILLAELSKLKAPVAYEKDDRGFVATGQHEIYNNQNESDTLQESVQTNTVKLENELLCVFAKNPTILKDKISNCDIKWTIDSNKQLFETIKEAITNNPKISARELIGVVHSKNPQYSNKLTSISGMFDMQQDPNKQVEFIELSLEIENIDSQISKAKAASKTSGSDEFFNSIIELQQKMVKLKNKRKKLLSCWN